MGSGIAANLMKAGFAVRGFDLSEERMAAFAKTGGVVCDDPADVGNGAEAVFVMVMNGAQAAEVVGQLATTMAEGTVVILSATIKAKEARAIWDELEPTGIAMVDSPVSGGRPGADGGTLTMMAAGSQAALTAARPAMEAVSANIHHCGDRVSDGQTVKACLQSLIGGIFTATYEACALAAAAGADADAIQRVFSTSAAGCGIVNGSVENIINGRFEDTGSLNSSHFVE